MCGKIIIFLITIFLRPSQENARFKQAEIRGGLLFERDIDRPVIVNPNYIVYRRRLDLKDIYKAVELTHQFTFEYKKFCDTVQSSLTSELELRYHGYQKGDELPIMMAVTGGSGPARARGHVKYFL